jgi:hypothetical protein
MAEFERSLIQERVRAGLRNAKLNGKTLGRPRRIVSGARRQSERSGVALPLGDVWTGVRCGARCSINTSRNYDASW